MNIEDVTEKIEYPDDLLLAMFEKQNELTLKYHDIEKGNGLLQTTDFPVNIDDRFGQARLKDLAWRIVEELAEGMECRSLNVEHFREEMSDALHFFIELLLSAGLTADDIQSLGFIETDFCQQSQLLGKTETLVWFIVEELGLAMNCLKNKPWKQTHMETDRKKFTTGIIIAFESFIYFLMDCEFTPKSIYDYYFRKYKVNEFRQRSQY